MRQSMRQILTPVACLCLTATMGSAQEGTNSFETGVSTLSFRNSWTLDARYINETAKFTNLRPTTAFTNLSEDRFRGTGIWSLGVQAPNLSFSSQLRFTAQQVDGTEHSNLSVDEAFIETNIGDLGFVYLGRKHQSQGKALGISILDLFNTNTDFDRTLNVERRERDIKGVDTLGAEFFVNENATVALIYAPSTDEFNEQNDDRYQISVDYAFFDQNLDVFAAAFYEKTPTLAFGASKAVGDAWVIYGEAAARKGRNRIVPTVANVVTGTFTDSAMSEKVYGSAVLGFGYTTPTGLSLNVEYLYNGDGYSSGEWNNLTQLIDINNANLGTLGGLAFGNLASLTGAFKFDANRRNYLFTRVATPSLFTLENTTGEFTVFHNLDDNSGNFAARIEHEFNDTAIFGLTISQSYGARNSEFGLIGETMTAGIYVTKNF